MNYKMTRYILGQLALITAAILVVPLVMSFAYKETATSLAFGVTVAGLLLFGVPSSFFKPQNREIKARCGIIIVALSWIGLAFVGCLPFWISGYIPSFIDSFFETVSGLTTTGSTILTDIEALPKSLLFWRSFTHWIGGMGVLVLAIAVLPKNDPAIVHLMKAEVPGPQFGKLVSKIRFTARILYGIYIVLTLVEVIALMIAGMNVFDAFIHSFGTAGTGGFSNHTASIGYYDSVAVDAVVTTFMMIFSVNFNLFYFALIGHVREAIGSEELRVMLGVFMAATLAVTVSLLIHNVYPTFFTAFRYGAFQVAAVISTTGYATADFATWPVFCQALLFILMFMGGSAGSTAGGLKVSRIIILAKSGANSFRKSFSPRAFRNVRMDGKAVDDALVGSVTGYFLLFLMTYVVSILLVSLFSGMTDGGFLTDLTAVTTCINNVGPGLGAVSPSGSFAGYGVFAKIILALDMLLGRLEIIPILLLFNPSVWKSAA